MKDLQKMENFDKKWTKNKYVKIKIEQKIAEKMSKMKNLSRNENFAKKMKIMKQRKNYIWKKK